MVDKNVLSVGDLVATESLSATLIAGKSGMEREVLWAHSCEMVDPAQWLGPHELLMTVGLCVPRAAVAQEKFIARLDDAGLAGMMIGDHDTAPPLSAEMLAEADRRGFPIVLVAEQTPYAVIARHVAAANVDTQALQVLLMSKLYHLATTVGHDPSEMVQGFADLLRIGMSIVDVRTDWPVISSVPVTGPAPTHLRSYPLPGGHALRLELREFPGEMLDSFVLVHLMKILEMAAGRLLDAADRRSEVAERIMSTVMSGSAGRDIDDFLEPFNTASGFHLAVFSQGEAEVVARAVSVAHIKVIVGVEQRPPCALIPRGQEQAFRELIEHLSVRAGLSTEFSSLQDARAARREAESALASIEHGSARWAIFEGTSLAVLARSRREANEIISGVLGPLTSNDARMSSMRDTLFAFLRNDRRWQQTAAELGIHRQTLAYRLNRIEELTGMTLARTSDLSALWIASQAWELTRESPEV